MEAEAVSAPARWSAAARAKGVSGAYQGHRHSACDRRLGIGVWLGVALSTARGARASLGFAMFSLPSWPWHRLLVTSRREVRAESRVEKERAILTRAVMTRGRVTIADLAMRET